MRREHRRSPRAGPREVGAIRVVKHESKGRINKRLRIRAE